jgi:hypothetical protein
VVTTATTALVLWLVKRRFVNSIRNPVARTVVSIVDRTAVGMPVVLLVATADLALTAANGVVQSLLAGGYVIKIMSTGVADVCASAIREREEARERNALLDSWVRIDVSSDTDINNNNNSSADDDDAAAALPAPALESFEGFELLPDADHTVHRRLSFDALESMRESLLADPNASVCIVPVSAAAADAAAAAPPVELELSRADAARLLTAMAAQRRSGNASPPPVAAMTSSVLMAAGN